MASVNVPNRLMTAMVVSVAVTLVTAAGFAAVQWRSASASRELTRHMAEELTLAYAALEHVNALQSGLQHATRLRDPDELERAIGTLDAAHKQAVDAVAAIGAQGDGIKARLGDVAGTQQLVMEAVLRGDLAAASDLFLEKAGPQFEAVQGEIRAFQQAARQRAEASLAANDTSARTRMFALLAFVLIVVGLLGVFQWRTRASVTGELRRVAGALWDASSSLSTAAGQVASTSQSVSIGATKQAAALEETSASLEEMSSMTRLNAEHAAAARTLASTASTAARQGDSDMIKLGTAIDEIRDSSAGIGKIVKSIDEIAFQTNILALNAAVEAARAGEAGMGFAVVADEVRNLAQRAAHAARETTARIEDSIAKSQRGTEMRDKVIAGLHSIVEKATEVDGLVAKIADASAQQRQGIEQIASGVVEMERVTQNGAAGAEEGAASAEELRSLADRVRVLVGDLQHMVTDGATVAPVVAGADDADQRPLRTAA